MFPAAARIGLAPAAAVAWAVSLGVVGVVGAAPVVAAASALAGAALAAAAIRRTRAGRPDRAIVAAALAVAAAAGVAASVAVQHPARHPEAFDEASGGPPVTIELVVTGHPVDGRMRATAIAVGDRPVRPGAPVLLFADGHPSIGSVIRVSAGIRVAEPGDDIAAVAFARDAPVTLAPPAPLLAATADLRARFRDAAVALPGDGGPLLPGLAVGDTTAVPATLNAAMRTSSLTHLTAVSGANCAVVVGAVLAVGALLGVPRGPRIAGALLVLAGFVALVTPEPSVLRAAVMAAIALVAVASGRPAAGTPVLAAAVVVLLVADPWLAQSVGFALSVLATAGLLLLAGPLTRSLSRLLPERLAAVVAIPIAAQVACQPVLLVLDPSLPTYGVVANLLAAPAAPVATVLGLLACLLLPVVPPIGSALAWLAWVPSAWIAAVAQFFAGMPAARGPWPSGAAGVVVLIAAEALVLLAVLAPAGSIPARAHRVLRVLSVVVIAAYLAAATGLRVADVAGRPADWQFAMCDVGQGDALLIRAGDAVALIDTGPAPEPLAACLGDLGVGRIDLLVLTHFDRDHVGGVDAVAGRVVRALAGPPAGDADERILAALAASGTTVERVRRGDAGTLGGDRWTVLWPPPTGAKPGNEASVALLWTPAPGSGRASALLLGDLGEEEQRRMLGAMTIPGVDVVKVAHHGSGDQAAELYARASATAGLIGVGADNGYGHPDPRALGILAAAGTVPLRTDLHGLVLVAPADSSGLRVWTRRPAP